MLCERTIDRSTIRHVDILSSEGDHLDLALFEFTHELVAQLTLCTKYNSLFPHHLILSCGYGFHFYTTVSGDIDTGASLEVRGWIRDRDIEKTKISDAGDSLA